MSLGTAPAIDEGDTLLYRNCVYPFALFLAFNLLLLALQSTLQWAHPGAPWWQQAPEMLVYPLQTTACAACLWHIRRRIPWACTWRGFMAGVLFGLVGIALWLLPYYAGWVPDKGGFDPAAVFGTSSAPVYVEYVFRFVRAAVVVPFVEELFWRGFLMRWCINPEFPQKVPFGTHRWRSYILVTVAFMLAHSPVDYAGALLYGTLAYILTVKTKRLMPVVIMHAVANCTMGICALVSDLPQLW